MPLSEMQQEYLLNCTHRWNIKTGATASGKSWIDYSYVIPQRILKSHGEGLIAIFGNTQSTVNRNIIEPMRELWGDRMVGRIKTDNSIMLFGKKCYVLGADNQTSVEKIQGSTIEYAYGDEVATWNREVFEMLKSRLRCEHSVFDGTCNPEGPEHWFKKFIDSDADIYHQHYTIDDNPFLIPKFVEELKKEYSGTVYYDRFILGKWTLAEGLIYPRYINALAKVPEGVKILDWDISVDYGTENAFAALLWGHGDDGVWYAVKEYYYSGRDKGVPKTDEEYADELEKMSAVLIDNMNRNYQKQVAEDNPYAAKEKLLVIVDPSASSFIATLRKRQWFKVLKAINDVDDGIRQTAVAMNEGLIKIDPACQNWRDEAAGYAWDSRLVEQGIDRPVKTRDHCLTGDTLIDTVNGQVPIRELVGKTGEVYCYDEKNKCRTVSAFHDVRRTQKKAKIYKITLTDGTVIRATGEHPVLTENGWKTVNDLDGRDAILKLSQGNIVTYVGIAGIEEDGNEDVYNMEVDNLHNFSVNGGYVVHNCMDSMRYQVVTRHILSHSKKTHFKVK